MNLYFLVEGKRTEQKVYSAWIPMLFPGLTKASRLEELQGHHFMVTSAGGCPFAKNLLSQILQDIKSHGNIDHLFVCIDAEEEAMATRHDTVFQAIQQALASNPYALNLSVIVQNRTMETWFLGNRRIVSRAPQKERLRECLNHYSVVEQDPEHMPLPAGFTGTHADCHLSYLKAIFAEHNNMSYQKSNPGEVLKESYLEQLIQRAQTTHHLQSFNYFLQICQNLRPATQPSA